MVIFGQPVVVCAELFFKFYGAIRVPLPRSWHGLDREEIKMVLNSSWPTAPEDSL